MLRLIQPVFDTVPPRTLTFKNKLLSLRGRVHVVDATETLLYEAVGAFAFFRPPTWRLHAGQHEVASIRRRVFTWRPTWDVRTGPDGAESFVVCRKLFSWGRRYYVVGGRYDGAQFAGSLFDLSFELRAPELVARAKARLFSLRDTHDVELLSQDPADEFLAVITCVILHLEHHDEAAARRRDED